jgi:hypothetical protein
MRSAATVREDATGRLPKRNSRRLRRRVRVVVGGNIAGTGDMLCESHPRLRQCQPKRLIVLVIGGAGHSHAYFSMPPMVSASMFLNDPHREIPD